MCKDFFLSKYALDADGTGAATGCSIDKRKTISLLSGSSFCPTEYVKKFSFYLLFAFTHRIDNQSLSQRHEPPGCIKVR